MTSTYIHDRDECARLTGRCTRWEPLAELPPLPVGALMYGAAELLDKALDLPQPRYVTVSSTQHIGLQFDPARSSYAAITKWALRFGGVLVSEPDVENEENRTHVRVEFTYYGVEVNAYAFIPAATATT
jgi:hypothetical protein